MHWKLLEEEAIYLMSDRKQKENKGLKTRYNFQRLNYSNLLIPNKPYFLKFPEPPKMALPAGEQKFNP
jgi:hypothetical protein